ncbi:MAG: hypothetical protein JW798_00520 [Prolixibacteraceae bacterium]|nr:hypothetical protein [Prolixibacteraceae bacterium]
MGETFVMEGDNKVITRTWKATDYCKNEAYFEQTITIEPSAPLILENQTSIVLSIGISD